MTSSEFFEKSSLAISILVLILHFSGFVPIKIVFFTKIFRKLIIYKGFKVTIRLKDFNRRDILVMKLSDVETKEYFFFT